MRFSLREAIEQLAEELLRRHGAAVPVDVEAIARGEGLRFQRIALERCAGAYARDVDPAGWSVAFINANHPRSIQRYTMAHELAHHLMDERTEGWVLDLGLPLPPGYTGADTFHEAHEYFGASLLMPRSCLAGPDGRGSRRDIVTKVATICGVSPIAAAIRIEELSDRPRHLSAAMYDRLEGAEHATAAARGLVSRATLAAA